MSHIQTGRTAGSRGSHTVSKAAVNRQKSDVLPELSSTSSDAATGGTQRFAEIGDVTPRHLRYVSADVDMK